MLTVSAEDGAVTPPDGAGPQGAASSEVASGEAGAAGTGAAGTGAAGTGAAGTDAAGTDAAGPGAAVPAGAGTGAAGATEGSAPTAAEIAEIAEIAETADAPTPEALTPEPPAKKSRRFPSVTKDTARPEGGGRAAPGDAPAPARQWPMLTVLVLTGIGLLLTAFDVWRPGALVIGAALLTGAVLRWALPSVGMLAVRSRFTDMVTYGILGVAIVLLALMAQPDPLWEIPFLDETLHFTISS